MAYVSEFVNGGRIVCHGKIDDLSEGFTLKGNVPFSLYIRQKSEEDIDPTYDGDLSDTDVLVTAKCYEDCDATPIPVAMLQWSPVLFNEIEPDTELLRAYDIYWGAGTRAFPQQPRQTQSVTTD